MKLESEVAESTNNVDKILELAQLYIRLINENMDEEQVHEREQKASAMV